MEMWFNMIHFSTPLRHFSSLKNVCDFSMNRSSLPRFIIVVFIQIYSIFHISSAPYCILCCDQTDKITVCLAANEEYYQLLMINDSQPSGLDVSSYTIEEIDSITSEYTLKNNVSHWIEIFQSFQLPILVFCIPSVSALLLSMA